MAVMTRCDKDGVPCIVQGFTYNPHKLIENFIVRIFNGKRVKVDMCSLFENIDTKLWDSITKHEMLELLENYFNKNLHLLRMEE